MNSRVLVAVIGKDWATARDNSGGYRLEKSDDLVRLELRTALDQHLPVVPVLIDGASMPREDQLPAELQAIVRRNAIEVRDTRWTYDVRDLAEKLAERLGVGPRFARVPQ